jgi:GDP-L-fucose synthase
MKILVPGGLGFVGRHVSRELLARGHEVVIVDNLTAGSGARRIASLSANWQSSLLQAQVYEEDIRGSRAWEDHKFDAVVHLAAIVGGRLTIENNPLSVAEDLEIDSYVIRKWHSGDFEHLTYLSSSAAYPISLQTEPGGHNLIESDIDFSKDISLPDLTYGWAKLTGEYLIHVGRKTTRSTATVIRPFSGYGADQDSAYPFPSILARAAEYRPELGDFEVWGSGLQERDFIHISDVAKAISGLTEHRSEVTINLGTGIGTNFIQLASYFLVALGHQNVKVVGKSTMPEGVMSRVANTNKFNAELERIGEALPKKIQDLINENILDWKDGIES